MLGISICQHTNSCICFPTHLDKIRKGNLEYAQYMHKQLKQMKLVRIAHTNIQAATDCSHPADGIIIKQTYIACNGLDVANNFQW